MGVKESIPARPQSKSYQCSPRSARPLFNFTGIKDLHKNSYFSCLCNDPKNENEKKEQENLESTSNYRSVSRPESRLAAMNEQNILDSFKAKISESEPSFDPENDLELITKIIHAKGKSCIDTINKENLSRVEDEEKFYSLFGQSPIFKDDDAESLSSCILFDLNQKS